MQTLWCDAGWCPSFLFLHLCSWPRFPRCFPACGWLSSAEGLCSWASLPSYGWSHYCSVTLMLVWKSHIQSCTLGCFSGMRMIGEKKIALFSTDVSRCLEHHQQPQTCSWDNSCSPLAYLQQFLQINWSPLQKNLSVTALKNAETIISIVHWEKSCQWGTKPSNKMSERPVQWLKTQGQQYWEVHALASSLQSAMTQMCKA